MTENLNLWQKFSENNQDFLVMRKRYTPQFYEEYYKGLQEFLYGDWDKSKEYFDAAEVIIINKYNLQILLGATDGPCQHKIKIMKKYNFQKPIGWLNYGENDGH